MMHNSLEPANNLPGNRFQWLNRSTPTFVEGLATIPRKPPSKLQQSTWPGLIDVPQPKNSMVFSRFFAFGHATPRN